MKSYHLVEHFILFPCGKVGTVKVWHNLLYIDQHPAMVTFSNMFQYETAVQPIVTINAPVNLTAPCIIFSGGFFSLRGRLSP